MGHRRGGHLADAGGQEREQVDHIRQSYRDHYDKDLDEVLRDETSGKDREHVDALLKGKENKGEVDAVRIQAEMDGVFGDEEEVLKTLERAQPRRTRGRSQQRTRRSTAAPEGEEPQRFLLSRIEADGNFSADQKERARNLIGVAAAPSPEEARRLEAEAAAGRIKVAVDGMGTDENTVRDMLGGRSRQEIDDIAAAYEAGYGHNLRDRWPRSGTGPSSRRSSPCSTPARTAAKDPGVAAEQDAARLKQAVDGMGTDEDKIRDILGGKSKAEIDDDRRRLPGKIRPQPARPPGRGVRRGRAAGDPVAVRRRQGRRQGSQGRMDRDAARLKQAVGRHGHRRGQDPRHPRGQEQDRDRRAGPGVRAEIRPQPARAAGRRAGRPRAGGAGGPGLRPRQDRPRRSRRERRTPAPPAPAAGGRAGRGPLADQQDPGDGQGRVRRAAPGPQRRARRGRGRHRRPGARRAAARVRRGRPRLDDQLRKTRPPSGPPPAPPWWPPPRS